MEHVRVYDLDGTLLDRFIVRNDTGTGLVDESAIEYEVERWCTAYNWDMSEVYYVSIAA